MQCADYGVYAAAVKTSLPMSVMLGEVWTGIVVEWRLAAASEYLHPPQAVVHAYRWMHCLAQGNDSSEPTSVNGRVSGPRRVTASSWILEVCR